MDALLVRVDLIISINRNNTPSIKNTPFQVKLKIAPEKSVSLYIDVDKVAIALHIKSN